jgi:two-component system chemotaxis sensor kinase CheA
MLIGTQRGEQVELSRAELERVLHGVRAGAQVGDVCAALERFLLEPLQRPLERLGRHARLIAERFGKAEAAVVVSDGGIFADPQKGRALWSVLVHVVRNAVDHGFETSRERSGLGKPPENNLRLWARLEAGDLLLDISDDGRGIDWQRVRAICAQRGLRSQTRADLVAALFAPDLSTRSGVTSTSGRGVGLAAVQRDVQALGGTISIDSETGNGSTFRLRIPAEALGAMAHDLDNSRGTRRSLPAGREVAV